MKVFRLTAAAVLVLASAAPALAQGSAEEIARLVQQRYDRVHDFTADFTHTYQGGVLNKTITEKGTVQIKKPGRMRWEYTTPERKTFVSDGSKIYSYVPADRQVIVADIPREDEAATAVLFLAGKGNLLRDFTVRFAQATAADRADQTLLRSGPDTWALRLDPKHPQQDYDWLTLVVDRQTMQIRTLVAEDRQAGRSTFQFSNYRENTGLADKIFAFKIPRGVDVITSGGSR
jgi:outer membrane lipoprotein carrier protein